MVNNYVNKIIVFKDRVELYINLVPNALLGVIDIEIRKHDFVVRKLAEFASATQSPCETAEKKTETIPSLPLADNHDGYRQEIDWCRWSDSNRHMVAHNGF